MDDLSSLTPESLRKGGWSPPKTKTPAEVQALECLDPLTCGILGDENSLCEACKEKEFWFKVEKDSRRRVKLAKALARKRIEEAKQKAIAHEEERLLPLLTDLRVLRKLYPRQFLELLLLDADQADTMAEFILDLIGPFLDEIYEPRKRRSKR